VTASNLTVCDSLLLQVQFLEFFRRRAELAELIYGRTFVSPELKPGKYTLGMELVREKAGPNNESIGTTKLYVNEKVVAEGSMRAQVGKFTLSGDGLCIGYDSGDAVSQSYKSPGTFTGGTILFVGGTIE